MLKSIKFRDVAHWSRMKSICSEIMFASKGHQLYINWVYNHQNSEKIVISDFQVFGIFHEFEGYMEIFHRFHFAQFFNIKL